MKKHKKIFQSMKHIVLSFGLILFMPWTAHSQVKGLSLLNAIEKTLSLQPAIQLQQKNVEIRKGALQEAKGQFDPLIQPGISYSHQDVPHTSLERLSTGESKTEYTVTTYEVGVRKLLPDGTVLYPNINVTRQDDLSFGTTTTNKASVNFTIEIPLLKGRGKKSVTAFEMAAETSLESSELDLRHTISQSILQTGIAYWNVLTAWKSLEILKESARRALQLVKDVKELIEADERPASDIDQLEANLASKREARIKAEQTLYEARQNLGIAMGLKFEEINKLPSPSEDFPKLLEESMLSNIRDRLIKLSMENRSDIMSYKKQEESAKILLVAAALDKRPRLNLSLNLGYTGLDETDSESGYYGSFWENVRGLNFSATLSYQFPIKNNSAKGVWQQRKFAYQQAKIQTADLERKICSDTSVALEALVRSIKECKEARKSVDYYKKALENEKLKLRMGMTTVIDVVTMEDYLMNAMLAEVSARQKYANSLLQLRYSTGTILAHKEGRYLVSSDHLISVP